ncbi:acetyl-CoA carboxylase biotin carboxyl carrier protein subunit [Actinomadura chokoriensis]|uniref:Biotin carboxyl carrier protein of acetyl-CoA carboxylase n=1 Tax=Actinomadura chokoriensis TaxID=454156 RepID=A0ABV4R4S5_9ACTN
MTGGDTTPVSEDRPVFAGESGVPVADVLEAVRRAVADLLTVSARPPDSLRVRVGDIAVEIEWPATTTATATSTATATVPAPTPGGDIEAGDDGRSYLCAPGVGVFYRASEPGAAAFVAEGDVVVPGQQVAILEVMKLMVPIEADQHGRITEVLRENGTAVEYGERLFALAPA